MDHLGPWLIFAVVVLGWIAQAVRGVRRLAARGGASAAPAASGRLRPPGTAARTAPPAAAGVPRTTQPTRRVPLATARPDLPDVGAPAAPSPGGRALVAALGTSAGLRNAVVLAEVLAPPVALR